MLLTCNHARRFRDILSHWCRATHGKYVAIDNPPRECQSQPPEGVPSPAVRSHHRGPKEYSHGGGDGSLGIGRRLGACLLRWLSCPDTSLRRHHHTPCRQAPALLKCPSARPGDHVVSMCEVVLVGRSEITRCKKWAVTVTVFRRICRRILLDQVDK